ncbi:sn-glycerol-3-phosphate ABC transporter ATP-binding protein UgpC [bacterium]|nr:sn-glycerol-3-phosphate ABC transporter ATP-binding protein UgpC [bacterium]
MAKVRIENVVKRFDRQAAVNNFSLQIDDGEFIVLVGPSGCGKTTLLRMVAGLETVTEGEMFIDGVRVTNTPPKKRDIAMVFQNYALYPHMTVYNNLAFSLKLRKFSKEEIRKKVTEAAAMLGLADLLDRHPNILSGGQKQRVALGRAIVRNPRLFLFDEPLSNLDAKLRVSMRAEILDIHRRLNSTSIYVTHDQMEAMTMGTRIIVMKDGTIQQNGTPREIYNHPVNKFVGGFIGSPAMNIIRSRVDARSEGTWLTGPDFQLAVPDARAPLLQDHLDKEIYLGIRPESFCHLGASDNGQASFEAVVTLVEPLGSEQLIHFTLAACEMVAKLDPHIPLQYGDRVKLGVKMSDVHFFDLQSEQNLQSAHRAA